MPDNDFIDQYQTARDLMALDINSVKSRVLDSRSDIAAYGKGRTKIMLQDGTVFRKVTSTATIDNYTVLPVTNDTTRRWIVDAGSTGIDLKAHAGAAGDGTTDDTNAVRRLFAQSLSSRVCIPFGDFLTDAIAIPQSGWTSNEQNTSGIYNLSGQTGRFAGSLQAKTGLGNAYLFTWNNAAGVDIQNLSFKGAADTKNMVDLSWKGTPSGGVAPANRNNIRNLWIQGGSGSGSIALNLDQVHDSPIAAINIITDAEYALSMIGGGGMWSIDSLYAYGGKCRFAAQNGGISNSFFTRTVELVGGSYNDFVFTNCQWLGCTDTAIKSLSVGNATRHISLMGCTFFPSVTSSGNEAIFEGRFWNGATMIGGRIDSTVLAKNITGGAGAGVPVVFRFIGVHLGASFGAPPTGVIYDFVNCTNYQGVRFSTVQGGVRELYGPTLMSSALMSNPSGPTSLTLQGAPAFLSFTNSAGTELNRISAETGVLVIGGSQPIQVPSAWNSAAPFFLGSTHLWIDGAGKLRVKSGAQASSDTDGTIVGTQS